MDWFARRLRFRYRANVSSRAERGIDLAREYNLINNFMWANDYPHQEGSWPHPAAAIERTMGDLTDAERARILGRNAAELFGFKVPDSAR